MTTTEQNKLIAKFMGQSYIADSLKGSANVPTVSELKYNSSCDWLIPVVEKIGKLKGVQISTSVNLTHYRFTIKSDGKEFGGDWPSDDYIGTAHKAIVEFIQWYNENTPRR